MHVHTVISRLKNGSPDLSEDPTAILSSALIQCREMWRDRGSRKAWPNAQWAFVRRTIEPMLYARIEPEPEHYEGGLLNPRGIIQAQAIELSSVSFENGPVPIISGYAQFEMTFDRAFVDTAEFYDWQESTDYMDWGLYFGFRFADGGEWDSTYEHRGIDFEVLPT